MFIECSWNGKASYDMENNKWSTNKEDNNISIPKVFTNSNYAVWKNRAIAGEKPKWRDL